MVVYCALNALIMSDAVLKSLEELKRSASMPLDESDIILELDGLSGDTKKCFEQKLNRYKSRCGCEVGSWFLFGALIVECGYLIYQGISSGLVFRWRSVLVFLGVLIMMALVGKVLGMILYRLMYIKTVVQIIRHLYSLNFSTEPN